MKKDDVQEYLDLRRAEIDPEVFAAALTVQHVRRLIAYGGSEFNRPDWDSTLHPQHLEAFLIHAVEGAQKTGRFVQEWLRLQQILPSVKVAWQKGQYCFQEHLAHAGRDQRDMEYLSQIDFAVDCYAYVAAYNVYPNKSALQAWLINGYMVVWRQHFLTEDEAALSVPLPPEEDGSDGHAVDERKQD